MDKNPICTRSVEIYGLRIHSNPYLVEDRWTLLDRSWIERMLSRPWRPFQRWRVHLRGSKPMTTLFRFGTHVVAHPVMVEKVKRAIKEQDSGEGKCPVTDADGAARQYLSNIQS